jgi:hypothetical protein
MTDCVLTSVLNTNFDEENVQQQIQENICPLLETLLATSTGTTKQNF